MRHQTAYFATSQYSCLFIYFKMTCKLLFKISNQTLEACYKKHPAGRREVYFKLELKGIGATSSLVKAEGRQAAHKEAEAAFCLGESSPKW